MKKIFFLFILSLLSMVNCRENIIEFSEESKTGKIFIETIPPGADIFFENSKTGKTTPDSLTNIQPGTYSIKLRLTGYADENFNVSLRGGQKRYINISFRGF